jgi:hypothetical protein
MYSEYQHLYLSKLITTLAAKAALSGANGSSWSECSSISALKQLQQQFFTTLNQQQFLATFLTRCSNCFCVLALQVTK